MPRSEEFRERLRMTQPQLWICAPSRALMSSAAENEVDHARIDAAEAALHALGWTVCEADNVRSLARSFAGEDDERARGFEQAMCAPEADLVLALRGGSGAARILDKVDWDAVGASQAVFAGFSDLTAINLALLARCGKASWQGPVAASFAQTDALRDERFMRALSGPSFEQTLSAQGEDVHVEGFLWGGNLSVLTSLIGTPYFPKVDDGILYLEDVNEPAWRISRMISQLRLSGVLSRQKLVLAGDFTGADRNAGVGGARYALQDALRECGVAVIRGLPFGHIASSLTLPFGVKGEVRMVGGELTVRAFDCPVPTEFPGAEQANGPLWWI